MSPVAQTFWELTPSGPMKLEPLRSVARLVVSWVLYIAPPVNTVPYACNNRLLMKRHAIT